MSRQHAILPAWVWQMLLMGVTGLSGIVFVPVLLRWAEPELMASVLVEQTYVYYLAVLVQYGFVIRGPDAVAKAADTAGVALVWQRSVGVKLLLLVGPVVGLFGVGCVYLAWGQWYVWIFAALLWACALNSNWWLQTQQRFADAVGFAVLGATVSALLVYGLVAGYVGDTATSKGAWLVLVLILPQVCIGFGSWWVARRLCAGLILTPRGGVNQSANLNWLRTDAPLVASQLLILASTTLGTVVVGGLADAQTTAAYAATEKLFNLAATVLVGLFMAFYPRLAGLFYAKRNLYWRKIRLMSLVCVGGGLTLAALLAWMGPMLIGLYLPDHMVMLVVPVLWPLGLWLGLCISQQMFTCHLVLANRHHMVLWANSGVLLVTVLVGYVCAQNTPVAWVYGMVAGQVLALVWLLQMGPKPALKDAVTGV